jgi:pyridoxal phosphate phosphatase PHOSPHO2
MKLAVFDFDHTIIDVNSDTYIDKLIVMRENELNGTNVVYDPKNLYKYSKSIEDLKQLESWTWRMNGVFDLFRSKYDITKDELIACLHEIKVPNEMKQFINTLATNGFTLIIISNSNTVFIDEILRNNEMDHYFEKNKIFTNPAQFDNDGKLIVTPFNETQKENNTNVDCMSGICAKNICKGSILRNYISKNQKDYTKILYAGDGQNDYCPSLYLNERDHFLVRENFPLAKLLREDEKLLKRIKSNILFWNNGGDIEREIFS